MTITTALSLEVSIDSRFSTMRTSKANITNALAGNHMSTWLSTGIPGTGAIPTATVVVPTNATTGAFNFPQQTAPMTSYIAGMEYTSGQGGTTFELHDRLAHMGGLSGTVTTLQTVTGFDLSTLSGTSNLAERKGDANYSDVQWWLEIYNDLGGTNSNATVNVTFDDGTTGNLTVFNVGNNDRRLARMIPLNPQIAVANQGRFIRGINSVQLSASTTTAGNFGFVATRYRGSIYADQPNERYRKGWTEIGLNEIYNNSCLFGIILCTGTATGVSYFSGKIING